MKLSWLELLLVNAAVKATVAMAAAWGMSLLFRRGSAASRRLLWLCALILVLALPLLSAIVPAWRVDVAPAAQPEPAPAVPFEANALPPAAAATGAAGIAGWAVLVWAGGAFTVTLRFALGLGHLRWLTRHAKPFGLERTRTCRPVRVVESDATGVPMTWGWIRPVLVLPRGASQWPAGRVRLVVLHELSHIERRDWLAQVLATAACALYWFHPLVWAAARQFRAESERACDDRVLAAGIPPFEYARQLLEIARATGASRAAVAMASSDLEPRLRAVLDPRRNRRATTRGAAGLAAAVTAGLLLPLAGLSYWSQAATGRLSGTVRDASGAAVPQATVVVVYPDSRRRELASTSDSGEFGFQGLAAGVVTVEVRKPGFALFERKGVAVNPAVPQRLDAILELGRVSESIEVVAKAPPRPAATPLEPPRRIRVGGNVQATRLVDSVKPVYPEEARSRGIEGTVQLQAVISTSGELLGLQPVNTLVDPALTKAAIDAVRQWHYQPTLLNGEPVEVVTTITVKFRLAP